MYSLHINLNSIHLKYTHISKLPDLIGIQQLHSSCAFVEVIFEGDAAVPSSPFFAISAALGIAQASLALLSIARYF